MLIFYLNKNIIEMFPDTLGVYMTLSIVYILVGMTVFTTIIEIVRRQYAESWRKMQELRAQIQAQLKLADHLKKLGEAGELDEAAQAELDAIQKKLGKYKGKYGKEIGIDELEWVISYRVQLCLIYRDAFFSG